MAEDILLRSASVGRVLCVGLVALDLVNVCKRYPNEDEDTRAVSQRWQTGGNACNTAGVLVQLGVDSEFFGSLSEGFAADFVCRRLQDQGIRYNHCVYHKNCGTPTSSVILNLETGSRTIVHSRNNLPELSVSDFRRLSLTNYDWIHFEGRKNIPEMAEMIDLIGEFNSSAKSSVNKVKVSIELEKGENLLQLIDKVDVVFVSKDFAKMQGFTSAFEVVQSLHNSIHPWAFVICPWGEVGAHGIGPDGVVQHSDAYPPEQVVDSLGAGDTFIAGAIYSLLKGSSLNDTLNLACSLAGFKCGMHGYDGLVVAYHQKRHSQQT